MAWSEPKSGIISGPLLDRIDIQVEVQPVEFDAMSSTADGESSASIRARVVKARDIQSRRFADNPEVHCNAQMTSAMLQILRHQQRWLDSPQRSHDATQHECPCQRPHPQGGSHHSRPRRQRKHQARTPRRSHQLPQPRPRQPR